MKRKIYKGGVDNYPFWWYGQSNRLQNFGDRANFLVPHGAVFKGNGYYFNGANSDYMEDIYGRHLIKEGTNGLWSQLYLTNSAVPPCGSAVGTGDRLWLANNQNPKITGKIILYPKFCPKLTHFNVYNNNISYLDVSEMVLLVYISISGNTVCSLNISKLVKLQQFWCHGCHLSNIDITQNVELYNISGYNNSVSSLDVSNNSKITTLDCHNNLMGQSAVDKVLCDANAWNTSNGTLDISGNIAPSQTGIDAKNDMVNNRGWTVTTD